MKRFVKCFFELLTQNSAAGGQKHRSSADGQGVWSGDFLRSLRKNTTRPLTVWIVGTDVE